MTNNSDNRIVVAFHIGRGGQFHNPGHKTYKGEINFTQLCNSQKNYLYEVNRDSNGRFCRPYLIDAGGNTAVTPDDYGKDVGVINYDFDYDKWICCYIDDCDDSELMLIYQAGETWTEAYDFAKNKLREIGMLEEKEDDKTIRQQAKESAKSLIEKNIDLYNEWAHTSHNHIWIQVYPDGEVNQTQEVDMNTSHYLSYPYEDVETVLEIANCQYCDCDACASYRQSKDDDIEDQCFYEHWGYNKADVSEDFAQHLKDYEYYDYEMAEKALEAIDAIPHGYFDDEE